MGTEDSIRQRIAAFPRWHYEFDLGGVLTPIHDRSWINRHRQRKQHFFDPLAATGFFKGKRVLDIGCNAGFWSLAAIEAGCEFVLGIDAREMHIGQANLVFDIKGVARDRYRFELANVYDYLRATTDRFDFVFCFGILYHVSKPMELLEGIRRVNTDVLLIDSTILNHPGSLIELRREPLDDPRMSSEYELIFLPSPQAVRDMVGTLGYQCVTVEPKFTDWEGCDDFRNGDRLAFACATATGRDLASVYGIAANA